MAYEYTTQGYTVNDSGRRLVVDPVTRIEGHLRCEVNINDDNVITNAVSCGTMFRGLEIIVKDRDPRDIWAFVERICGVCTGTHALASVHAIEDALKIDIPDNANIIRNLMQLALWYHDHLVHFYQLGGLDWIDVVSASKADPKETSRLAQSLSPWPQSSPGYFASVKEKLVRIISTGQLGIFKNGYWGHPGYKFPPEANLMLVAHYIEALDFQKDVVQIHTVFGGKNPHPNWLVGGVPLALNINGKGGADVINMERLELVLSIIKRCREFSAQVLVPTVSPSPSSIRNGCTSARASPTSRCWRMARFRPSPTTTRRKACSSPAGRSSTATSMKCCPSTCPTRIRSVKKSGARGIRIPRALPPCIPIRAKPCLTSSLDPLPRGAGRTSSSLMKTRPIRGSRLPAGAAT